MSTIRFRWLEGIDLNDLIGRIQHFFCYPDYQISHLGSVGRFGLTYRANGQRIRCQVLLPQLEFQIDPAFCDEVRWSYHKCTDANQVMPWISFTIDRGGGEMDPYCSFDKNHKVKRMAASFFEDLSPEILKRKTNQLDLSIEKYHIVKRLFDELDCDSVDGNSEGYDHGIYEGDPDPGFEGRLFRFSKEGRQILLRPLEERRAMRDDEASDWRVVVDRGTD